MRVRKSSIRSSFCSGESEGEAGFGEPPVIQIKLAQIGERRHLLQAFVRDVRTGEIERFQFGKRREIGEACVADFVVVQSEPEQIRQRAPTNGRPASSTCEFERPTSAQIREAL